MIEFTISMHRKNPYYEVRSIITDSKLRPNDKESQELLQQMRRKLEQVIPGSVKPKYNLTHKELIVAIKAERANQAQSLMAKLAEFIKEARNALGTKDDN
ncbi:MAG: hypothetical protein SFT92_02390 [Rickettsiales bacterium]|nr:hypothetical protein [Rickettsiales bacterium]